MDECFGEAGNRVVMRLNLLKECLERTQPLPSLVLRPAMTTSPTTIAVCGGISNGNSVPTCYVFSSADEQYVYNIQMATFV